MLNAFWFKSYLNFEMDITDKLFNSVEKFKVLKQRNKNDTRTHALEWRDKDRKRQSQ